MAVRKKLPNGKVVSAMPFDYPDGHRISGITLAHNKISVVSFEGDNKETRILINEEYIKNNNIRIVFCNNYDEFLHYTE